MKDWLVGFIGEVHVFKFYIAVDGSQADDAIGFGILFSFRKNLAGAVKAGDGLRQLGADIHDLEDRSHHEGQKHGVGKVIAQGDLVGHLLTSAEPHDGSAHDTQDGGRGQRKQRGGGQRTDDVLEKPFYSGGKDPGFAIFRMIALDHTYAAEGFGEPAGDLGIDLSAFSEDWADDTECLTEDKNEG